MTPLHSIWRRFMLGIVSPAVLVLALFILAIFGVVTPGVERSITEKKKEMIHELTSAAWGILAEGGRKEQAGVLSRAEAQRQAREEIRTLRYGAEGKDYFWITDQGPAMIMHPYRPELEGKDVSGYLDEAGEKVFAKLADVARAQGEGYASYYWQWKDDPKRIAPKLSFVKRYEPWGWIIGTGVYLDDVRTETLRLTGHLTRISLGIAGALAALLVVIGRQSYGTERRRQRAEQDLRESEARYRLLVESAAEGILLVANGRVAFSNRPALAMLELDADACAGRPVLDLLVPEHAGAAALAEWLDKGAGRARFDALLRGGGRRKVPAALAVSTVTVDGKTGLLISLREHPTPGDDADPMPFGALLTLTGVLGADGLLRQTPARTENGAPDPVSYADLLRLDGAPLPVLVRQAGAAETPDELRRMCAQANGAVRLLLGAGARASHVMGFFSLMFDAAVRRLVELALRDLGPPPVPFALLALGSAGRSEQTLATDQDNALVYADPPPGTEADCQTYFLALGARVCDDLNTAGYVYCQGDVMARNPRWCLPLSRWRRQFDDWIDNCTAEALQAVNIVFDFRHAAGDEAVSGALRRHLVRDMAARAAFFFNLASATLAFRPPVGLFGKIVVETGGSHPETFDIKSGLVPVVNFVRVYALRHALPEVGTLERIESLVRAGVLLPGGAAELRTAFELLSLWRLRHQGAQMALGLPPDNHVSPGELTEIEQAALRKIFEQIGVFQARIRLDFTGGM